MSNPPINTINVNITLSCCVFSLLSTADPDSQDVFGGGEITSGIRTEWKGRRTCISASVTSSVFGLGLFLWGYLSLYALKYYSNDTILWLKLLSASAPAKWLLYKTCTVANVVPASKLSCSKWQWNHVTISRRFLMKQWIFYKHHQCQTWQLLRRTAVTQSSTYVIVTFQYNNLNYIIFCKINNFSIYLIFLKVDKMPFAGVDIECCEAKLCGKINLHLSFFRQQQTLNKERKVVTSSCVGVVNRHPTTAAPPPCWSDADWCPAGGVQCPVFWNHSTILQ